MDISFKLFDLLKQKIYTRIVYPPPSIINEPTQSDSKILFTCSIIINSRSLRLHAQELYPIKIKEFFFSEKGYYKSFKSKFRSIYVEIEL